MEEELSCPHCGSTSAREWKYVEYTRISYPVVRVTQGTITVGAQGEVEYESTIQEQLLCSCGERLDSTGWQMVHV